jgi:hypothetical protein
VAATVSGLKAQVEQNLVGGTVMSDPATNALVNLPTYFWVSGSNIGADTVESAEVTTPPEEGGRELQLTVALEVERTGTAYDWGDGQPGGEVGPDSLGSPGTTGSVTHTYHEVTVPGETPSPYPTVSAAGFIPISAVQNLEVSAWAIWVDSAGRHQIALGSFALAIPVAPTSIRVGQIEGVPYCPSNTSCS